MKCVTFEQAKELKPDAIIASIPDHWYTYKRMARIEFPHAKVVAQMGNMFQEVKTALQDGTIERLISSTSQFEVGSIPHTFYHQEIDQKIFYPRFANQEPLSITSFVNCLPASYIYHTYKQALPEYDIRAHGASCPGGSIQTTQEIADIMADSLFGYHIKPDGDGFGHVIHGWAMIGRPLIVKKSYYSGQLAESLLDGSTCIDLEVLTVNEAVAAIRAASEPQVHARMAEAMQQ